MADIQSNIDINIDTTNALANIKSLQRQISLFHQGLRASGSAANAAISENMSRNLVNSINATKKFGASFTTVQSATQSFTTALEKNKLSMGQYFKYAAGSTKTFGRLFQTEFNTIEHVAKSRVKTLQTQFIKLGRDAGGAVKAIRVRPLTLDMKDLATQTAINAQKQQLFNQLIKQGSTNLLNFGKNTQWAGRQLMVGFTVPLAYLGTTAARVFMDMEKQVIKLRRVYGDFATTAGETEQMVSQIKALGNEFTKYGVAVSKTMGLAADAAAMGKQGADLIAQVSEANRLAVLGGVEQAQALETTISVTNAFGVAAEDLAGKINFLNAVENQTVTSIEDLTIAIPKAGPVIQQLGGNVEDLAFFLTAMKEGGINASEGANALKSGLASIINPSAKASEFMQGFGISIKGIVDANKGNVKGIILGMADALDTLDPLNRARAIEQMFGKFQFARLSTLFQNVKKEGSQASTVLGLTKATAQELAILSERELKKVEDSPMFKFQKAIEDIKTSLIPLGEQFLKLVTPIIEFGTKALEQFNKLDSGVKSFIMGAIGILGGLAPAAIMAFGLVANGIANLIKAGNFLRNMFLRAGQGSTILGQQTQYMTNEQLEAAAAAASLGQAHQKLTQQFTVEATAVKKLADAYNAAAIAGSKLTAAGAVGRTGRGGGKAKGYNSGVLSVPGPKGAGDVVPAMLAPGEAVIPADKAKKYRGFISDMIQDKLPGFNGGRTGGKASSTAYQEISVPPDTFKINATREEAGTIRAQIGLLEKEYGASGKDIASKVFKNFEGQKIDSSTFRKFAATYGEILYAKPANNTGRLLGENKKQQERLRGYVPAQDEPNYMDKLKEQAKTDPTLNKDLKTLRSVNQAFFDEVLKDPETEKEYKAFLKSKKPEYVERLANWKKEGLSDQQIRDRFFMRKAVSVTGFDPNDADNKHGLGRAHFGGLPQFIKRFREGWGPDFTQPEPRVINGFISSLTKDGADTAPMKALEKAAKSINIDDEKEFFKALRSDGSLTPKQLVSLGKLARYAVEQKLIDSRNMRLVAAGLSKVDVSQLTDRSALMPKDENAKRQLISRVLFKGKLPFKYNRGVVSVPGPKGAGDVVPAMLSPGESVIPAAMSKKYGPLIAGMISDTIPGYDGGLQPPPPPPSIPGVQNPGQYESPQDQKRFGTAIGTAIGKAKTFTNAARDGFASVSKQAVTSVAGGLQVAALRAVGSKDPNAYTSLAGGKIFDNATGKTYSNKEAFDAAQKEVRSARVAGSSYVTPTGKTYKIGDDGKAVKVKGMTPEERKQQQKDAKNARKDMARQRSGRMAQGAMGLSMAVGALSMVPGSVGQAAQAAMGPIAGMTAAMALIPGVAGPIVGVLAAVGIGLMQMKNDLDNFKKEASATAKVLSSGTDTMKSISEFTGRVSASETMSRIRDEESSPYNIQTGKNTFGGSYLQSDAGRSLVGAVTKTNILSGRQASVSDVATQLSQAIATNVLTKEEAASIAYNLGAELKDYKFSANVLGKMTEILGPGGEDLTKQPLIVSARIIQQKQTSLGSAKDTGSAKGLISSDENLGYYGLGEFRGNNKEVAAAEIRVAQGLQDILDLGQQNVDNLELAHRARVEELTAAGDMVGLSKENNKFLADKAILQQQAATALAEEVAYLNDLQRQGGVQAESASAIASATAENKKLLFAEMDQNTKDMANTAIDQIKNSTYLSSANKVVLTAGITVENLDDYQKLQNLFPVDSNTETWEKIANVAIKYGPNAQEQLIKLGGFFGTSDAAKKSYDVFVKYVSNNADGEQILNDLTEITRVSEELTGTPIEMDKLIDTETGDPLPKLKTLRAGIKAVGTEITKNKGKSIKFNILPDIQGFDLTKEQIDYFNSLPPDQQKTYTTTFLTVEQTITKDQLAAFRKTKITENAGNVRAQMYWSDMKDPELTTFAAGDRAYAATKPLTTGDVETGDGNEGDTTGGAGTDPLDALLKRLKEIRQAAVIATGGMNELFKWMKPGALATKEGLPVFSGIEQQLSKKGYRKDFIDFITSADDKIRDQYVTIKNGIVTVKKSGIALQKLFDALSLGEYERSVQSAVEASQQELNARKELLKNQMPYADAVEAARDSTFAQNLLIAKSIENEKERAEAIKKVIALYKEQKKAVEDVRTEEEQFNDLSAKISKKFDADRNKIGIDFELRTSGDKNVVSAAQQQISEIRNQLDDYNAGLTRLEPVEESINEKYDDRIASLENIRDLNDRIAEQKNAELDIASALARGDVSAAAAAIQKEQQRQAEEAMDAKIKNLEKQREAELSGLTTRVQINGQTLMLTKEQINKRIKDLETQIFNIEEDRLEPAQTRIELATYERDLKLKALDDEKLKWDQLKNKIDLAATASLNYAEALKEAIRLADIAAKNYSNPTAPTAPKEENWDQAYLTKATMDSITKANPRLAKKLPEMLANSSDYDWSKIPGMSGSLMYKAKGGIIPSYFANGDLARGTDTVPAMLTPGEFVMSKYAVDTYGTDTMSAMNSGELSGGSVYNSYAVNVNVRSDANPDQIARAVMGQIRQVNNQQLRGNRF